MREGRNHEQRENRRKTGRADGRYVLHNLLNNGTDRLAAVLDGKHRGEAEILGNGATEKHAADQHPEAARSQLTWRQ